MLDQRVYEQLKKAIADQDYMYIYDLLEKASKEDFLSIFRERNEGTILEIAIRRPYILATISNDARRKGALEEFIEGILYYSKQEGYKSKLEAFWKIECEDDDCYAIKNIKAILANKDEAQEMLDEIHQIENSILFERLQKAIENKNCITSFLKGSSKGDFLSVVKDNELLNKAISCGHYEAIRDILSMAKKYGILKEFEKDINDLADRIAFMKGKSSSNALNTIKESCGLEDFFGITSEIRHESVIRRLKKDASDKAMKVGGAFVIAGLIALGGYFAAGAALSILTIIGIAIVAVLVTGLIAGGITYTVLKPSEVPSKSLDNVDAEQKVSSGLLQQFS